MGLKDSLASMVTDYVQLRRNPEFRSKTDLDEKTLRERATNGGASNRRHSLQIMCGTQDPRPDACVHQRTYSLRTRVQPDDSQQQQRHQTSLPPQMQNRRGSEPAIPIGKWTTTTTAEATTEPGEDTAQNNKNKWQQNETHPPSSSPPEITTTKVCPPEMANTIHSSSSASAGVSASPTLITTTASSTTARARSPISKIADGGNNSGYGHHIVPGMFLSKSGTFSRFLYAQRSVEEPLFEEEEQQQKGEDVVEEQQKQQQQQLLDSTRVIRF